jgi:tetratricopeptide (TPR) repeat protein
MRRILACLALVALTLVVFAPVAKHEFMQFDTLDYVLENDRVLGGLTAESVRWAFFEFHVANWHPLTWLSHMLDVELFGLDAGAHHMVNVVLHALSAMLLFLTLERATRRVPASLFVAAVFAVHPLHVESVAWVAERKDVLSTLFGTATLYVWVRYTQALGRSLNALALTLYALALALFALGLLSKSMLVTLPCVMLLLDFWPLERGRALSLPIRLLEKFPFFALALASCALTVAAQRAGGAVKNFDHFSLAMRLQNTSVAYATYVWKTLWPTDLAIWYPHPRDTHSTTLWVGAYAGLALATVLAALLRKRAPYLLTGWLWFLGTLVPVIGLMQVGGQSHADRYMYVPQTGLAIAAAFGAGALLRRWRPAGPVLGLAVVAALSFVTWKQLARWRTTDELFQHTVRVTERNYVAHNVLGLNQVRAGRLEAGIAHFRTALHYQPTHYESYNNLGRALIDQGELEEAGRHFEWSVAKMPDNWDAYHQLGIVYGTTERHEEAEQLFREALRRRPNPETAFNLGLQLDRTGRTAEALEQFRDAVRLKPEFANAHTQVGIQLIKSRRNDEAEPALQEAVRLEPGNAEAHYWLGGIDVLARRDRDALPHYERALAIKPSWPTLLSDFAFVLATSFDDDVRDPVRALELAERANTVTGKVEASALDTLAACYAAVERFEEAAETARRALALAEENERASLARKIEPRIALYEAGHAYRATPP